MKVSVRSFLDEWLFFAFSDKLKFAIKVSLSFMLAYMIPIAMGWAEASTATITIMIIAGSGRVSESVTKGILRIIGTVIGAIIGIALVALFPQEREFYLIALSLVLLIFTYLYYAYQGDKSAFTLSIIVMMMIYLNAPEEAFIYGIDRTYMTLFGIVVYSFVGIFLWPIKAKNETINDEPKGERFIWLDPEYFKATFVLFLVYWFSVGFWILLNPPGGFYIVIFSIVVGLLTSFSPLKPIALIVVFSFGFIFATLMYVAVLPNLVYAWELALFLFFYTFIAFYFINPKITILFLLGLFTLDIENTMSYDFDVFLMTLLAFYILLAILMFFDNFPFSSKPEHLFRVIKERFFSHAKELNSLKNINNRTWLEEKKIRYHNKHLEINSKKLKLWGSKVDTNYFNLVTKEQIELFTQECERYLENFNSLESCYNASSKIDWQSLKVNKF